MNILIAGASGLIGQALTEHFEHAGHRVIPLRRKHPVQPFNWQPDQGTIYLDDSVNRGIVTCEKCQNPGRIVACVEDPPDSGTF